MIPKSTFEAIYQHKKRHPYQFFYAGSKMPYSNKAKPSKPICSSKTQVFLPSVLTLFSQVFSLLDTTYPTSNPEVSLSIAWRFFSALARLPFQGYSPRIPPKLLFPNKNLSNSFPDQCSRLTCNAPTIGGRYLGQLQPWEFLKISDHKMG